MFQVDATLFTLPQNSNFGGGNGGVATAIVNATAPSPRIRLRIVDRQGRDINGARLGEELYLRLDLDDDSKHRIHNIGYEVGSWTVRRIYDPISYIRYPLLNTYYK